MLCTTDHSMKDIERSGSSAPAGKNFWKQHFGHSWSHWQRQKQSFQHHHQHLQPPRPMTPMFGHRMPGRMMRPSYHQHHQAASLRHHLPFRPLMTRPYHRPPLHHRPQHHHQQLHHQPHHHYNQAQRAPACRPPYIHQFSNKTEPVLNTNIKKEPVDESETPKPDLTSCKNSLLKTEDEIKKEPIEDIKQEPDTDLPSLSPVTPKLEKIKNAQTDDESSSKKYPPLPKIIINTKKLQRLSEHVGEVSLSQPPGLIKKVIIIIISIQCKKCDDIIIMIEIV